MRTTRSCLSLLALTLSFTPLALAQFSDPVMTAQAPRPGSYHDYIGIGAEVVNPADGSLSFDLPIRLPPGRELSMPFGIRYTGSDQFQLNHFATSLQWVKSQFSPFEVGGWSYLLPAYTSSSTQKANGYCYPPNCPFNPTTAYCDYTSNYMFRGFDSGFYNLGVGSQWPDATYPSPNCQATATGSHFGRGWLASTPCSGLTVTDPSGSTYQFSGPVCSGSVSGIFGALAYSITDRNGNQISLQNTRNSVFSCCTPMSGNAYIDTLGRQAVSWTGLGNNNDNITIAGLGGNVVLKWGTATAHFPESAQVVWDSGLGCTYTGGQATTIPALTEIDLPNGQKYSFTYDATYGLISKISFPGGGYVRYVWNLYSSSSASGYLSYTYPSGPNAGQTDYCFAIFDTPAISDRYVSYDGQTEVLHQTFRYSTSWNTFPGYPVPDSWSAKSTTVTSTDLLTGQSTVTNYAYAGVLPALGPYDYSSWNPKIPVEQTIVY